MKSKIFLLMLISVLFFGVFSGVLTEICNAEDRDYNISIEDTTYEVIKIDDYNMYLCRKSLMYIMGTTVDYKEDIMGSRFDFTNDQIDSKCGCGTSVNFK